MIGSGDAYVPSRNQTPLEGITVSQMIAGDIKVSKDGAVTGTINYLSDVPGYDGEEQKGHFFPVKFPAQNYKRLHVGGAVSGEGFTAGKDFTPSVEDPYLVIRVENCTDGQKVSVFDAESRDKLFTLDFSGATLKENPVAISAKRIKKIAIKAE